MVRKVVGKKSRPHDVEYEHANPGDSETRENANDRRDEEPFLDVARVRCGQVFVDQRGLLS
jgi:hypothetical protein